jgi:hypothetical protein
LPNYQQQAQLGVGDSIKGTPTSISHHMVILVLAWVVRSKPLFTRLPPAGLQDALAGLQKWVVVHALEITRSKLDDASVG